MRLHSLGLGLWLGLGLGAVGSCGGRDSGNVALLAPGSTRVLDDFDSVGVWQAAPADGVSLEISADSGREGGALKLDFNFHGGGGYAVARRALPLRLPQNYQFSFWIRGNAPVNNLEFKLIDASGENVWWVNRKDFEFPPDWTRVVLKKRHISFAWGPRGGGQLDSVATLEFAITAGQGGNGTVWIDELAITALEPAQPYTLEPHVRASATSPGNEPLRALDADPRTSWRASAPAWIELDFQRSREFGGLVLDWDSTDHARDYAVMATLDTARWDTLYSVRSDKKARDHLFLPESEARWLRIDVRGDAGAALREIDVKPLDWAPTRNDFLAVIAKEAPRGSYPRYLSREAAYWTIVGLSGDSAEALIDSDGGVEVDKRAFSIVPALRVNNRLLTWSDVRTSVSLQDGYLPIPSVDWTAGELRLTTTALAVGEPGSSTLLLRYHLNNTGNAAAVVTLFLTIQPFQVNPTYQFLNNPGGGTRIESITFDGQAVTVNNQRTVLPIGPPTAFAASTFDEGNITERLRSGELPRRDSVTGPAALKSAASTGVPARSEAIQDRFGGASAALAYEFMIPAQGERAAVIAVPFHSRVVRRDLDFAPQLARARAAWHAALDRVQIDLPPQARHIVHTLRSNLAWILINRDGPAIQPGSRAYERSWIRDGSLTSAALLRTGHAEEVRAFLDWYAPHQYSNGKVPCCVDARGADPVPEHDSHGQLIYAIAEYWRFTRDNAFLQRMWPHVAGAVAYIDSLRQQRRTDEYRAPDKRVFFGILPPSISHEGYSAKPMHSYWDDFFALKGLKDAVEIAQALQRNVEVRAWSTLRDEFRRDLLASIAAAMQMHRIDYLPGAADLGDFDATSTTIAVAPAGELANLPAPAVRATFDRYYEEFLARKNGEKAWDAYTPYELRLVGTFIRLGEKQRAHELLDFFFRHQRPAAWNQWAEVVWNDSTLPRFIGDMPHTWVGSDYIRSVLDMFAYERAEDGALVIGAGIPADWVTSREGVRVSGLRSYYGRVAFSMRGMNRETNITVQVERRPPGGIIVRSPSDQPIRAATVNGRRVDVREGREIRLDQNSAVIVFRY